MIISLDKFKNKGSGGDGNGKYVVPDGTKFAISEWEYIPEELDFSQVTRFDNMFQFALNLKQGLYLDDWSKVTNCMQMYLNCRGLESVPDMNTSNCINFNNVFDGSTIVNAPNIDVSNASSVQLMFNNCPNLQHIGVLKTINVTLIDDFYRFCTFCPNLTTIEGIDFSGIVDSTVDNSYNGPVMFHQNDSLTNITVNGAINFSWANDYGFNALPNLTFESIESILTAMSNCINPEISKTMLFNYVCQDDTLRPLIEDCQSKGWDIQGIRFKGEEGVIFEDGDAPIIIPYTGETQELTIPFNWYDVPDGAPSYQENWGVNEAIRRNGINCNIEVIEGAVEGYNYALYIVVDPNLYNETINDLIEFVYIDWAGNWTYYSKTIELQANPDSQLGLMRVSSNYEQHSVLPSSVDRLEILFNVENAEYQEAYPVTENLENFNVSFEPTDTEGYTHVAYITYDNKGYYEGQFALKFSNGYAEIEYYFRVEPAEQPSDGNTGGVFFDDGDEPITIPYTGETQALTIPFNWYPGRDMSWHENYWINSDIRRKGIYCDIEVTEGAVVGYTHALRIQVDANPYNETINDFIVFNYIDSDGNWMEYSKVVELQENPDSQLGFIDVWANHERDAILPSSADRFEILFNVENAEYHEALQYTENLENFNVSFEPTDIEGYTHVAYITYDNKAYYEGVFALKFSNGLYSDEYNFRVDQAKLQSDVDTSVWGNPDEAIPVTMAEFIAAEPSTTQWYEIKGRILGAPQVETGMMIIQSIDGDTGQTIYFVNDINDIETIENALFVNYCWDVAMMNPVENGINTWFPGNGMGIIIRTLKHSYDTNVDTIERLSEDNNGTTVAGKYNGSPCAVYVGTFEPEPEPEPDLESNPFMKTVDTSAFGDPSNAIPVSFTEFAAAEPSNEQWYELTGVIRACASADIGALVLDDPTGEYTVDEPQLNSWPLNGIPGIFISGITIDLIDGIDTSFGNVFPGDGETIVIRTLKHVLDADYNYISWDNVYLGDICQGSIIGGKLNSPCAVYLGSPTYRPD